MDGTTVYRISREYRLRVESPANPGGGNPLIVTVPAGEAWELETLWIQLNASAVAGNRSPRLEITNGTDVLADFVLQNDLAAGGIRRYSFVRGFAALPFNNPPADRAMSTIPTMVLLAGYQVKVVVGGMDVGDTLNNPKLLVRVYDEA